MATGLQHTRASWATVVERIDRLVANAAAGYLQGLRRRGHRIDAPAWSRELDLLARGRNVDYGQPGLPLMYAIRYMPKRVIALMGELSQTSLDSAPRSLLDIGTGTGAVPAAIHLLWPQARPIVRGLDASSEMLEFARESQRQIGVPAVFEQRTLSDLLDDPTLVGDAGLVTLSAPFHRSFVEWDRLAAALAPASTIFASEPTTRSALLDAFESALRSKGWSTYRGTSDSLPAYMREVRGVPAVTRFWRRIGSPGAYQPQTWWEPPAEGFLYASH